MTPEELDVRDVIEFTDDEGNTLPLEVVDYFFYNGEEYASLREPKDGEDALYVMKVNSFTDETGEEMEEFVPPADELIEALLGVARTRFKVVEE